MLVEKEEVTVVGICRGASVSLWLVVVVDEEVGDREKEEDVGHGGEGGGDS